MENTYKYTIAFEEKVCFNYSVFNVIHCFGLPKKIERKNKSIKLTYNKSLFGKNVNAKYLFSHNRLNSVIYSYEPFGFVRIDHFLKTCEKMIINNIQDSCIYYESCGKRHWEITDGIASQHICMFQSHSKATVAFDFFEQ